MNSLFLFTDGSVNTKISVGIGSFLAIREDDFSSGIIPGVKIRRFENTSSTKLEIETMCWALSEVDYFKGKITVYTDSRNIIGLPGRRERLVRNGYISNNGNLIKNAELYQQFFQLTDKLDCEFVKIRGHKKTSEKDNFDRLFSLVDRASRKAVREEK